MSCLSNYILIKFSDIVLGAFADIFSESSRILIFCFLASELLSNDTLFILHLDLLF